VFPDGALRRSAMPVTAAHTRHSEPILLAEPYPKAALEDLVARFGSPLLLIDCARIGAQYQALAAALPGVALCYALKPLPEAAVVTTLRDLGAGFDLASGGEIELVRRLGVDPARCIHTHPIKRDSDIRDGLRFGVRTFVADNPDELGKFVRHRKRAQLLLRVALRSGAAVCDLSRKFGCEPEAVPELLTLAQRLGVRVAGLSFHVGSQALSSAGHVAAIDASGALIDAARRAGSPLDTLDIGGGFPARYLQPVPSIEDYCAPVRAALARLPGGISVLAEPGRYLVAEAGTCVSTVIGRARRDRRWWYYLDDGLYGCYSGQLYDHMSYPVAALKDGPVELSVLAGPTCDSIDVIREDVPLPELEIGDLIVGRVMGAYTHASATDFNFLPRARVLAINTVPDQSAASDGDA
jgi:ornithine decarboxylase